MITITLSMVLAVSAVAFAGTSAPAYQVNGQNNCWWTCGKKTGLCTKTCGPGGYCCRRDWKGCSSIMSLAAPPNFHTCIKQFQAYQVNGLNNCWWTCGKKTGPCLKTCGGSGYCCRKGWKGCDENMQNVAPHNFHTCIKYRKV